MNDEEIMSNEVDLEWVFFKKCKPNAWIEEILVPGEEPLISYKTVRDVATITNKRIIVCDTQGITGKKKEIFSIPFRSIDTWATENPGHLDVNAELELWTKSGHFKFKLNPLCDVREFDLILANGILL